MTKVNGYHYQITVPTYPPTFEMVGKLNLLERKFVK